MRILLSLFLFFSVNIYSADLEPLSEWETQQLTLDDVIRNESRIFNELFLEGLNYAGQLTQDEERISSLIFSFASEEISNEDLWITLDSIKGNIFKTPDIFEEKISKINYKSQSTKEFFQPLYTLNYNQLTNLSIYLRNHARLLSNQIESLETADLEKYDYFLARSGLLNTDHLMLMADSRDLAASIIPKTSIPYYIYRIEASFLRISGFAQKINSLYLLNELDQKNLKEIAAKARNSYRSLTNTKLKENLFYNVNRIEKLFKKIVSSDEMETFNELSEDISLYYDSSLRVSEDYLQLIELYEKNKENLSYTTDSTLQGKEFDYINEKIGFDRNQNIIYGESANQNLLVIQDILLTYAKPNN